jgi:electron transport complex protein RnfG
MDRQLPVWASVALVVVISAALLVSTHLVTQVFASPEGSVGKDSAQGEAMPAAELFVPVEIPSDSGLDHCYKGQAGGQTVGYAAQVTVKGYAGPVEVVVGMDMNGMLTGISVDGSQFNETPDRGAKAKEPAFRNQFVGIATPVGLKKGSDATSSATGNGSWATTSPAATAAADATSSATQSGSWATTAPAAPAADATSSATQSGDWATTAPAADATSGATQSGDWATTAPAADATSGATQSGDWATTAPAATAAPAATEAPASASTIDAISGATITSDAVVNGVNQCAAFIKALLVGGNA